MAAVKNLRWHGVLGFCFFTTYHTTVWILWEETPGVPLGCTILATQFKSTALATGVTSDSRAKVDTIKAFQVVNRIVCRIQFAVDLRREADWTRRIVWQIEDVLNTPAFTCSRLRRAL
jgi:hypothetical protein